MCYIAFFVRPQITEVARQWFSELREPDAAPVNRNWQFKRTTDVKLKSEYCPSTTDDRKRWRVFIKNAYKWLKKNRNDESVGARFKSGGRGASQLGTIFFFYFIQNFDNWFINLKSFKYPWKNLNQSNRFLI